MKKIYFILCSLTVLVLFSSCKKDETDPKNNTGNTNNTTSGSWTGKLVYNYAGDGIKQYEFSNKSDKEIFEGGQPHQFNENEVLYVNETFPGQGYIIKIMNLSTQQARTIIDFTNGEIGGKIYDPQLSPDGKYVAFTVTSWSSYQVKNDAVLVYTLDGQKVAQFDSLYTPSWTPDGKVVMCGSYTYSTGSAPSKSYKPGIFISDAALKTVTRIDKGLNDPAPYQTCVSPDGKRVAFVMNKHVWVIDIDGNNQKQITAVDNDNEETFPRWSPDGKNIACWSYKTFERSYYTAIAIVPGDAAQAVVLKNDANVWPRDNENYRLSGGNMQLSWIK